MKYVFRRGFIYRVEGKLDELLPPCGQCEELGHTNPRRGLAPDAIYNSPGTGRDPGVLRALFGSRPVTAVTVTDKEPRALRTNCYGWYDAAHFAPGGGDDAAHFAPGGGDDVDDLPTELFDLLSVEGRNTVADLRGEYGPRDYWAWYDTRAAALAALSAAVVAYGRSVAGLSPLAGT